MSGLLEQLGFLIEQVIVGLGYPGIFLVMLIENVFPPIPSELVMPLAGFFAGEGKFTFAGVWIAGTLGSVLGAVVLYYIGAWANTTILRFMIDKYGRWIGVSNHHLDRALGVFGRYGEVIVFAGRLIPIIRSIISVPAGMHRMHFGKFLAYTTLGSAIWTGVLAYAGLILGQNWSQVLGLLKTYQNVTLVALAGGFALFVAVVLMRRMRRRTLAQTQRDA
jgi:membrane protein DedA with SNARE-associated domain